MTLFDNKTCKLRSRHAISDNMNLAEDKSIEKVIITILIRNKKALHLGARKIGNVQQGMCGGFRLFIRCLESARRDI